MSISKRCTIRLCFALLICSAAAWAQISSSTGAIEGTVTDPQNAAVAAARVSVTNTDTGASISGLTQVDGTFVFPLLAPGNYRIQVLAPGFESTVLEGVKVEITKVTNANARLRLGQVSTVTEVSGAFQTVDTRTATTGDVITGNQVREIPLPTRNFLDLTALQAGTAARMQSAATVGRGSPTLDVAGSRGTTNNFVLDGVDANSFGSNSLSTVPVPNPDAVGEFRVSTSMYDASQGRGSGGNINVVLRSGTDHYHGGAFEFYRSNDFNANDFFANSQGKSVPVLLQNQFGGQVGGPVPKVKDTFWFFSYQGTRQKNGVSSLVSGSQPVMPDVRTAATLGAAFGVSPSSIDPVAVNILNQKGPYNGLLYPSGSCAGVSGCTGPGSLGLLVLSLPTIYNEDQESASVERNLFRGNHLAAQFFFANITQYAPTGGGVNLGQGQNSPAKNKHAALTDTETFSPNLLNEFRAGFTNIKSATLGTENVTVGDIGMSKWDGALYPGIPALSISGLLSFGGIGVNSFQSGGNTSITIGDTLSWTRGKHTLRVGIENRRYAWNVDNEYGTRGSLSFPNFPSFLTGTPNRLQVDVGSFQRNYRAQDVVWFVQDDFRVTRRLTLNLGLRYDYLGFPYDLNGKVGNFDPNLVPASCVAAGGGTCVLAGFISPSSLKGFGTPGVSETTLTTTNKLNFAPRVGFAADLLGNGKLSMRGGFGYFYIRTSGQTLLQLIASPPWVQQYLASGTAVVGSKVLANPWPAGLPMPNQFPILPVMGQFNGTFTSAGAPNFVNPDGTPAVAQSLYGFTRALVTPYVQQYNLTFQYQLPKGWIVEAGYIGSHGRNLLVEPSLNQSLLANATTPFSYQNSLITANGKPGGITVTQNSNANATIRVPVPGFAPAGLNLVTNQGYSHYNGFILELSHAFAHGFQFKMDYTQSRSTDNDSGPAGSDLDSFQGNQLVSTYNRGVSDFDQPHRFVFTGVWNLPGPKKGWMGRVIGNWGMSGVYTIQSGLPFSVSSTTGGGLAGLTGSVTVRADYVGCSNMVPSGSVQQNLNAYVNPACFAQVANIPNGTVLSGFSAQQGPGSGSYTVGNNGVAGDSGVGTLFGGSGRNILRGPSESRFDLAATKIFPIHESVNLTFRAEAFKVFNNPIFSNPQSNISNSTFGKITSTIDSTGRILQLALKFNF
ncbi:MAG TPA: carboxypeptidase regulatory-like domain-containing protein [Candidatus Acidoferrales bacterium]|nr:carboxypeptidase regulatory-like domain-containing protein [Candidatus Acidoferrales bacterium]